MAEMLSVGLGHYVNAGRLVVATNLPSAPLSRTIQAARRAGRLVDATSGRRTRGALFMDDGTIVLTLLRPQDD